MNLLILPVMLVAIGTGLIVRYVRSANDPIVSPNEKETPPKSKPKPKPKPNPEPNPEPEPEPDHPEPEPDEPEPTE